MYMYWWCCCDNAKRVSFLYFQPYEDKLKDLQKLTKDLWERVKERQDRPKFVHTSLSIFLCKLLLTSLLFVQTSFVSRCQSSRLTDARDAMFE